MEDNYAAHLTGSRAHFAVDRQSDLVIEVRIVGVQGLYWMSLRDIDFRLPFQADRLHMVLCSNSSIAHSCSWVFVNSELDDVENPD